MTDLFKDLQVAFFFLLLFRLEIYNWRKAVSHLLFFFAFF